jgi:serine/threonine-protein kinase RsbW
LAQLWREQPDVPELDRTLFATAVLEIASNIVRHAAATTISLAVKVDPRDLRADFCDDGEAVEIDLDAADLPDELTESGRGLALVRMAVDELSYERHDNVSGWRLVRHRLPSGHCKLTTAQHPRREGVQ